MTRLESKQCYIARLYPMIYVAMEFLQAGRHLRSLKISRYYFVSAATDTLDAFSELTLKQGISAALRRNKLVDEAWAINKTVDKKKGKKRTNWKVSSRVVVETCRQLVDDATPRLGRSMRGTIFGAEKYLWREKYYISRLVRRFRDLSPISAPFSQVAASLFGQAVPVNQPRSHYRPVSISCYRHITSRRDARRQPSPLFTLLWPAHSTGCSAVPLSTVSVHYQRPGNDHKVSSNPRPVQTYEKFSNELCIGEFNSNVNFQTKTSTCDRFNRRYYKWYTLTR